MLARTGAFRLAPRIASARRTFLMMTPEEVKEEEQVEADLLKVLPDNMKPVIEYGAKARAKLADLGKANPQLVADMKAKLAAMPDKIVPTVQEPRDPSTCNYTEEGS